MREFITAVEQQDLDQARVGKQIKTKIDGQGLIIDGATTGQIGMIALAHSSGQIMESIAGALNLFFNLLVGDDEDTNDTPNPDGSVGPWTGMTTAGLQAHFKKRLWDNHDPFDPTMVANILREAVEEWTGRPTLPSGGSAPQQPSDGPTSTPTQPSTASTPSPLLPTGS